jgi:hypothetical protein
MKYSLSLLCLLLAANTFAQDDAPPPPPPQDVPRAFAPKGAVKWAPLGLAAGNVGIFGEYRVSRKGSITAKIGIPLAAQRSFDYEEDNADFTMKASSYMAGYRHYFSKKGLRGLYLEPFLKYVHHTADGTAKSSLDGRPVDWIFKNDYDAIGGGLQFGVQFLIVKRLSLDLFLIGPEYNSARNNFIARESSNAIPWTFVEEQDAKQEIENFIKDFPFIGDKTKIGVDRNTKTITADFDGGLPGFRTGFSIGFTF